MIRYPVWRKGRRARDGARRMDLAVLESKA
jgi:hypothetical protein